jgi:predicted SAM-dependent methyltransferase
MKTVKSLKKIIFKCIFFVPNYILEIYLFEFRSFLGRSFTGRLRTNSSKKNLVHLGCGLTILKGFINIDFFFDPGIDFGADLRYSLRIDSECIDGIFSEHTLEHLTYEQNDRLLKECHRILKPGSPIRIIVPDVSLFVNNYASKNNAWFEKLEDVMFINNESLERRKRRLISHMEAISFVTQEHLHLSCWDFQTMKHFLEKNNFRDVRQVDYSLGKHKEIIADSDDPGRKYISLYVEAIA